jgi:hypothetical protein
MSPRWLHWPATAVGADWSDYIVAGTSYWLIPDGTTSAVITKTGGDSSASWTQLGKSTSSGGTITTADNGVVTLDATYYHYIRGGFNQLSNPYQFCATWCDGTGGFRQPQAPGWIVWESESVPGTFNANLQVFAPIEVQSGVVGGTTTAAGYGPTWNASTFDDSFVFFFNSYTPGDVQSWTAWDNVTTT